VPADIRRSRILERIQRDGGASVAELARDYGVSAITVHRDLERLAADGLIERVRGGARPVGSRSTRIQVATDWAKRLWQALPEKEAIAVHAAEFVEDGSTVFIDASTTNLVLARHLERHPPRSLTLVTNSPAIALELQAQQVHIVVVPGEVDQTLRMIGGRWSAEFISGLNIETAFVSAAGVTLEQGLTTTRRALADTLHAAMASSQRTVASLDSTKFGLSALLSIARLDELEALIVDDGLPAETAREYEAAGVNLILASRGFTEPSAIH
jgi:DeoR/GlpR family transcriptional regulator of sugar metabolism